MKINCHQCKNFIPDSIGSGFGIGSCHTFDEGSKTAKDKRAIRLALMARGNHPDNNLFWGGTATRECKVAAPKINLTSE
jgi:hypothetical protein